MKNSNYSVRLTEKNYQLIKVLADSEGRSVASTVNHLLDLAAEEWSTIIVRYTNETRLARKKIINEGVDNGILPESSRLT